MSNPSEDHEIDGAPGQKRTARGGHDAAEDADELAAATFFRQKRCRGQRQQLALARGDRRAEQADPQRQVSNERNRTLDATGGKPLDDDFDDRQQHHHQQRRAGNGVLDSDKGAAGRGSHWRLTIR